VSTDGVGEDVTIVDSKVNHVEHESLNEAKDCFAEKSIYAERDLI